MSKASLGTAIVLVLACLAPAAEAAAVDCQRAQELTVEAAGALSANPSKAEQLLQEALGLCPDSAAIRYNLAQVKISRNRYGEATVYLQEAIRLRPDYAKAYDALAKVLMREGDQDGAMTYARKAVSLDPGNLDFAATLAGAMDIDTPPQTRISQPDAVAVVIGNRSYQDPILSKAPVEYALRDAEVMREYLVQALGFPEGNVIFLKDATLSDFLKVFGDEKDYRGLLYARVRMFAPKIFVFYSGHGAPDTNTKKAFIVPSDADPSVIRFTGYSLDTLNDNLGKIAQEKKVGGVVVALDSCFSGGYNNGMIIPGASPIFIEVDDRKVKSDNVVLISSSRKDQVSSWYPDKKHGLFTYFFLKGIKEAVERKVPLTAGDLENYLLEPDKVGDQAWKLYNRQQTPHVQGNRNIFLVKP